MERVFFGLGALSALLAVAAGAFGAHALRERLAPDMLAVAWALGRWPSATVVTAGWLFVAGTVVFSGSLYVLTLSGQRWLGAITPLGGLAFIAGWALLAWAALRG